MAATGCASPVFTRRCTRARRRREPQVLPAYGLQDLRKEPRDPKTKSNPNTMCLQTTLGEDHGSGHFYFAKNRTFLLCVDTRTHANTREHIDERLSAGVVPINVTGKWISLFQSPGVRRRIAEHS